MDGDDVTHREGSWDAGLGVLPGPHQLSLRLDDGSGLEATACVAVRAGHRYHAGAERVGSAWEPKIVDAQTHEILRASCSGKRVAFAAPAPAPTPEPHPFWGSPPTPVADVIPARKKPGSGFSAFFGFGAGGDDFVKATDTGNGNDASLSAGKGALFGLGLMLTPWWPNDALGLGAGVDVAWKGAHIDAQNGDASVTRYPLAFTVHLLTDFGTRSRRFLLLRAGVSRELGVHYHLAVDGQSALDADASGTWGGTVRLGYYMVLTDFLAADASLFATQSDHVINGAHIDANSAGLTIALHVNL